MLALIFINILLLLLTLSSLRLSWHTTLIWIFIITFVRIFVLFAPGLSWTISLSFIAVDGLRAPLISLTCWISALIILASYKIYYRQINSLQFRLFVLSLKLVLLASFIRNNWILFYIIFEASLVPTLLLILGWGYQPERLQAALYLIIYTIIASLPLLLRLVWLYSTNSHLSFLLPIFSNFLGASSISSILWFLFSILAFLVKMPIFIAHLWLPKAHVEAPVAGSIILAGILLKLGSYGLIRLFSFFAVFISPFISLLSSIALWGAVITSLICLRQTDIKSLIAYSSVGHIGLLTLGALSNTVWGWRGALSIILAHGLCSSALFALANISYLSTNSRSLFLSKGLILIFPAISFWWFLFSAANIAAPPSLNLLREILLMGRIIRIRAFAALPLGLIRFLAGAYSMYLFSSTQHGNTPYYISPSQYVTPQNFLILFLHLAPLNLFILKPEVISLWT